MRQSEPNEFSAGPIEGTESSTELGTIVSVRGSVVDARFEKNLPPMHALLRTGSERQILIEVLAHVSPCQVRCMALTPTQGLSRGEVVEDTGGPLRVPVGKATLSRMVSLFGKPIDGQRDLTEVEWQSIHRAPPPLTSRLTKSEVFERELR